MPAYRIPATVYGVTGRWVGSTYHIHLYVCTMYVCSALHRGQGGGVCRLRSLYIYLKGTRCLHADQLRGCFFSGLEENSSHLEFQLKYGMESEGLETSSVRPIRLYIKHTYNMSRYRILDGGHFEFEIGMEFGIPC